jgi:DNA-damage-inducible protein J
MYCKCNYKFGEKMAKTATIQARINPELKRRVQKILNSLNLTMSEAISLYLTQVTLHRGIPFDIKIPNELTAKTLEKAEKGIGLNEVSSVDELFRDLNS